jgi:hypothetical protein
MVAPHVLVLPFDSLLANCSVSPSLAAGKANLGQPCPSLTDSPSSLSRIRSSKYAARLAATAPFAALLSQAMLPVQEAAAAGGKLGLLEGKAVAMIHPLMMLGLFVVTLFTGYQGLMWRQVQHTQPSLPQKPIPHSFSCGDMCALGKAPLFPSFPTLLFGWIERDLFFISLPASLLAHALPADF